MDIFLLLDKERKLFFVIIEPKEVFPTYKQEWYKKLENESRLLKRFSSGKIEVEKREITTLNHSF